MGKRVKSARGQIVDFDLMKIKEQIASAPPPMDVKQRQDFVERRLRRRIKKKPVPVSGGEVNVEPKMPEPEEALEEIKVEEAPVVKKSAPKPKAKTTKQPARKSTTNE